MAEGYRLYFIEHGFVSGAPVLFEADDDVAAYAQAKEIAQDRAVEIWKGTKRLLRFGPKRLGP